MAEDVDAENPRKKIKLDEEPKLDGESKNAIETVVSSISGIQQCSGEEEQNKPGSSETPKVDKEKEESPHDGEDSDSDSSVSALSDLSGLSGEDSWKGQGSGPMSWVYRNMEAGVSPRDILEQIIPDHSMIPNVNDFTLWKLVINIVTEPPPRDKLPDVNTIDDVINLMKKCTKIMVLTGAGVSVSCGIPDFRSRNGVYARLAVDFPDLPDPQAMFDIKYFRKDQRPFFKFAKEIFPGQFEPSKCHKFIKLIESHGKLLRNYTQNIDTLEQVAGMQNVIQCHGSFATATCMTCSYKCAGDDIKSQIMDQIIPMCHKCDPQTPLSVMKPDIVFFGESLPEEFHQQMSQDKEQCDLLIVIGSSLKVRPVALIPNSLPPHVPQILINKEALRNLNFDVELLGDCDTIIGELCRRLGDGWESLANKNEPLTQISFDELLTPPATPTDHSGRDMGQDGAGQASDPVSSDNPEKENLSQTDTEMATTEDPAAKQCDLEDKLPTSLDTEVGTDSVKSSVSVNGDTGKNSETVEAETVVDKKDVDNADSDKCSSKDEQMEVKCDNTSKPTSGTSDTIAEDSIDGIDKNLSALNSNTNSADKEMPEGGPADESEELAEAANSDLKSMWKPKVTKLSVAQRLGPNQYCLIPPHRYVFTEAEVFTSVGYETDSSDDMMDFDDDLDDDNDDLDQDDMGIVTEKPGEPSPESGVVENVTESVEHVSEDSTEMKERPVPQNDHISGSDSSETVDGECIKSKPSASGSGENKNKVENVDIAEGTDGAVPSGEG